MRKDISQEHAERLTTVLEAAVHLLSKSVSCPSSQNIPTNRNYWPVGRGNEKGSQHTCV